MVSTYTLYVVPSGSSVDCMPSNTIYEWYDPVLRYRYYIIPVSTRIGDKAYVRFVPFLDLPKYVASLSAREYDAIRDIGYAGNTVYALFRKDFKSDIVPSITDRDGCKWIE